ncbi:MAG: hypothetical protein WD768_17080, partial [Phycisphaeraceae bacterium]
SSKPDGESASRRGTPADIWAAVLHQVKGNGPLSWVESLSLRQIDERTASLSLVPGKRDMHRFVSTDRQREQLASLLKQVLGRPVRVEIDAVGAASSTAVAGPTSSQAIRSQREEAMALPLVREVLNVFDASLVEARAETEAERNPVSAAPADSNSAPRVDAANNESDDEVMSDDVSF